MQVTATEEQKCFFSQETERSQCIFLDLGEQALQILSLSKWKTISRQSTFLQIQAVAKQVEQFALVFILDQVMRTQIMYHPYNEQTTSSSKSIFPNVLY